MSPTGPTHEGQPISHGQLAISCCVCASSGRVHAEQRRAEADAARIVVVEVHVRVRVAGRGRRRTAAHRGLAGAGVDRDAEVAPVAHQQQLRDGEHRVRKATHAVTPVVGRVRHVEQHGARHGEPVGRRVHLLLGQIEVARTDVLVGVEANLLEADHARHDMDVAVRSRGAIGLRDDGVSSWVGPAFAQRSARQAERRSASSRCRRASAVPAALPSSVSSRSPVPGARYPSRSRRGSSRPRPARSPWCT